MGASPDYNYIELTGTIVPDTSELLTDVQVEYTDAFGQDLDLDPTTVQGVLITAEVLPRAGVLANNAAVANQINPNLAGGAPLDAILALTGVERNAQTQTIVTNAVVTGVPGTIILEGSQAQTAAGDLFQTLSAVTLPSSGAAMINFASSAFGPIPCAIGALNQLVAGVLGWETVTNPTAGELGTTTQSDQGARAYRRNTLAFQGVSLPAAILSALYATTGVTSAYFQENVSWLPVTLNAIPMTPKSYYVCVAGGSNTAVAACLMENKSGGAGWNGGTYVTVTEPASGQKYTVQFDRPTIISVLIKVISPNGNAANIIQAILDYVAGNIDGFDGFEIGDDVSSFEIAGAILTQYPNYIINSVQVSLTSPILYSSATLPIAVNQQAATQQSYITVSPS